MFRAGSVQAASSTPFDLRDRSLNYTWSDFDRRHVFQGTYTYELPFGGRINDSVTNNARRIQLSGKLSF